jgi:hypothetical protein
MEASMLAEPTKKEDSLDEAAEQDIKTAHGMLGSMILEPEGEQAVVKALSSSNPPKMLAMFLVQGIEMVQRRSMGTDTPLDPRIWLANGGVVDELMAEVAEVASDNGVPFRIAEVLPATKQALVPLLQERGSQLKGEFEGQQQQQPSSPQANMAAPTGAMM